MDRNQINQEIGGLIKKYTDFEKTRSRKEMDSVSEANVRADFIDPLFEILGWDILNPDEYDRKHFIRGTGFADVSLKHEGAPVVFIEAKRFGDHDRVSGCGWGGRTGGARDRGTDRGIDEWVCEFHGLGEVYIRVEGK